MALFIDLPDDLSKSILLEFLDIRDWGVLDIALGQYLAKFYRAYLHSLTCPNLSFENCDKYSDLTKLYEWSYSNRIKLQNVYFNKQTMQLLHESKMKYHLENVIHLQVDALPDIKINDLIKSCTNLKSLSCNATNVDFAQICPALLARLKTLFLDHKKGQSIASSDYSMAMTAMKQCLLLEEFKCGFVMDIHLNLVFDFFKTCKHLSRLDLCGSAQVIEGILASGLDLQALTLRCDVSMLIVVAILRTYPNLEALAVGQMFLNKSEKSLTLQPTETVDIGTWEAFAREIEGVTKVHLNLEDNTFHVSLANFFAIIGANVNNLKLVGHVSSEFCTQVVGLCPGLKTLKLNVWCRVDFCSMLIVDNVIENLDVRGKFDFDGLMHILGCCRHLCQCVVTSTWMGCELEDEVCIQRLRGMMFSYQNEERSSSKFLIEWETTQDIHSLKVETYPSYCFVLLY